MTATTATCESFACPHCRTELRLRPGVPMVSGPCPSCGGRIEVPSPACLLSFEAPRERVKLPPPRAAGQPPMARSDEAPAPPAQRVRLAREVLPLPEGNNFGTQRPGFAARRRREQSRRAIWKNLLSLSAATVLILVTGAAVLNAFEKKAESAPEPVPPSSGTVAPTENEPADGSVASFQS